MKNIILLVALFLTITTTLDAQIKMSTSEYIAVYSDLATASMVEYKIPASIKMGQAILESSSGNSRLAQKANNHFGIKCKSNWQGEKIYHDDDAVGECFRKYGSPYDSYIDHNEFLSSGERYASLFKLDITDYKGWANGLKAAGYATSPTYATDLIRVIENNKLYELDEKVLASNNDQPEEMPVAVAPVETITTAEEPKQEVSVEVDESSIYRGVIANPADYVIVTNKYGVPTYLNNGVEFIIAKRGDTFNSISEKLGKSVSKLLDFNELDYTPSAIEEGSIIYIGTKKSKASNGYDYHTVLKDQTLHYVSQKYGIRIDKLAKLNLYNRKYVIKVGQKMLLR